MKDCSEFDDLRIDAAKAFAQTMIFVDDQASQVSETQITDTLKTPEKGIHAGTVPGNSSDAQDETGGSTQYSFDAKSLVDSAMDIGLICSVLRPEEGEDFIGRAVKTAQVADIVCLDWEIYDDGGKAASEIIRQILQKDNEQNGRLRLIAIYTGDVTSGDEITDSVFEAIPEEVRKEQEFSRSLAEIESKSGIRIVCLLKKHGIQLDPSLGFHQVSESELPRRLQSEFAKLSEGLLSNAALATIASIRDSTHHVLSKFVGQMDGPFFHHRATITNPEDAEEYAVNVILSELKGAVDRYQIGAEYTGPEAIKARIKELAERLGEAETMTLRYRKNGKCSDYDFDVERAIRMVVDGLHVVLSQNGGMPPNRPKRQFFEDNLSTLFSDNLEDAHLQMRQFAALTGVRAHPGSYLCLSDTWTPKLGLGTIIRDDDNDGDKPYLMCLQASCDSVRIENEKNFLFVRLEEETTGRPEHVVPITPGNETKHTYVGLSTSNESYCATRTIRFSASQDTKTVDAKKNEGQSDFYFEDIENNKYIWVADLKRRRALRTAQRLGQDMGRLGFDEFEPYRIKHDKA